MKNLYKISLAVFLAITSLLIVLPGCQNRNEKEGEEEHEKYDGPGEAILFEIERTKDPATGKVPMERYLTAMNVTRQMKEAPNASLIQALSWVERGPDSDVTGPSNGNTRANNGITSGRIRAVMVDSTDPTHKTVWVGGVDGGIWKTTDITVAPATWVLVNDLMSNLAISAIVQDPRPGFQNIMYTCTGESYSNADAVRGLGVFKSTDGGTTWNHLPSTLSYTFCTRIVCDFQGNVYLATRNNGLLRSTDGGTNWTNITPTGVGNNICDLEISNTAGPGRLHMVTGIFSTQTYRYTDIPATVTSGSGWVTPTTPFTSFSQRAEIAVLGNTLYALPVNASYQVPTIFKSTDGGDNWTATPAQPSGGTWANGQGWYSISVGINPANPNNFIVGGLDCYESPDGGSTWVKISAWVGTSGQYVHADQHNVQWWDGGNKLLFGCDGGMHYSSDGGTTIRDRNQGLRLKQFYSIAVHPTQTNYFLAGAQDNGTHQLTNPGLGGSVEVTGGDGMYVAIDQDEPQFQFGSYVYNNYRRSTNNGATWSAVNFNNNGRFVNPFDYDNVNDIFYAAEASGNYLRWNNPQTGNSFNVVNVPAFGGQVSAVHASPYTAHRVYFGTGGGRIIRVESANATPVATDITGAGMTGYVNCIVTGLSDQNMIACFTNYGVSNVWITTNGGTSWTAIDGNLPDMPVRWALFHPEDNTKAYIATETGVWETDLINGASTVWNPNTTFPNVRTDMIKYRSMDRTIAAGTHGRGVWTATVPTASGFGFVTPPASTHTCPAPSPIVTTLTTTAAGGFSNPITLTAGTLPPGTSINFAPNPVTPGSSTTVTFTGANTLPPNTYTITVTGTAATAANQTVNLTYIINGVPPTITTHPASQTVCAGTPVTFNVAASGTVTYQWQVSTGGGPFNDISGATGTSYSPGATTVAMNGNQYRAVVTATCGSATSNVATLTVNAPPAITTHPASQTVCAGSNATFSVVATGGSLTYQWEVSTGGPFGAIAGATSSSYTVSPATGGMNGNQYRVVVTGGCAPTVTSNPATLNVVLSPTITTQPANATACVPSPATASFSVTGSGTGILYQWQVSTGGPFTDISGATSATLNLTAITQSMNGNQYRVQLSNATCTTPVISSAATLTVNTQPSITTHPSSATLCAGSNNTFTVSTNGTSLSYQWETSTGGPFTPIAGATASSYTVTSITQGQSGTQYRVVITGACPPTITSNPATLTVVSPPTITDQPVNRTICATGNTSFSITAAGAGTLYQWESSPDGVTWTAIPGATSATLNLNNVTLAMNGTRYRVQLSNATCTTPVISTAVTLTVNAQPTVTITAAPFTSLLPGRTTTLTAVINPVNPPPLSEYSITWYRNNVVIPGATGATYQTDVTGLGNYRVDIVHTPTGCNNGSAIVNIKDSASTRLFVFPSPNDGRFIVSYHNPGGANTQQSIAIFDSKGDKVYHRKLDVNSPYQLHRIDLRPAARGVYIVVLGDAKGNRLAEEKFVIQ